MKKALVLMFAVITLFNTTTVYAQRQRGRQATQSASSQASSSSRYFTGNGGKDMSLAVLVPTGSGLTAQQNYLPTLVQGVLVGDLSKYSAISVLDRMKLEAVLRETESGIYRDNAAYGRLGEIAEVDYALTGTITKTSTGYAMQIQVVGTGKDNIGITKASYSGNCTIAEFDNFTGIRRASLELLTQMGVNLTDAAKQELTAASPTQNVNSQTAVAQGIIAQRQGNVVESLAKFYEAASYDPSFAEAAARANTMSSRIRTGSMRDDILNDIAWRNEWVKILADANDYLNRNKPRLDVMAAVAYDPNIHHLSTNYDNNTARLVVFSYRTGLRYPQYSSAIRKTINDVNEGLKATGRQSIWRLTSLKEHLDLSDFVPGVELYTDARSGSRTFNYNRRLEINVELINNTGRVIGRTSTFTPLNSRTLQPSGWEWDFFWVYFGESGSFINHAEFGGGYIFTVPVSDITDEMTVRVSATIRNTNFKVNVIEKRGMGHTREWPSQQAQPQQQQAQPQQQSDIFDIQTVNGNVILKGFKNSLSTRQIYEYREIVIPENVTSVADNAFGGITFHSIKIGANVILGNSAFHSNFERFYNRNKCKAGTYTFIGRNRWSYSP